MRGRALLDRLERGAQAPDQHIDAGLETDRRVRERAYSPASFRRLSSARRSRAVLRPVACAKPDRAGARGRGRTVRRSSFLKPGRDIEREVRDDMPAPARAIAVSVSRIAPCGRASPAAPPPDHRAHRSPDTPRAAGRSGPRPRSRSSEVIAGLTMRRSAPSAASSSISRNASRRLARPADRRGGRRSGRRSRRLAERAVERRGVLGGVGQDRGRA